MCFPLFDHIPARLWVKNENHNFQFFEYFKKYSKYNGSLLKGAKMRNFAAFNPPSISYRLRDLNAENRNWNTLYTIMLLKFL